MMNTMALWEELVIARPVALEIQDGQPQNSPIAGVLSAVLPTMKLAAAGSK
jgi:hypothetical protein